MKKGFKNGWDIRDRSNSLAVYNEVQQYERFRSTRHRSLGQTDRLRPDTFNTSLMMVKVFKLTLKAPITTAADDCHKYFSLFFRKNKI